MQRGNSISSSYLLEVVSSIHTQVLVLPVQWGLHCAHQSPGDLVKMHILMPRLWGGSRAFPLLTNSQHCHWCWFPDHTSSGEGQGTFQQMSKRFKISSISLF